MRTRDLAHVLPDSRVRWEGHGVSFLRVRTMGSVGAHHIALVMAPGRVTAHCSDSCLRKIVAARIPLGDP